MVRKQQGYVISLLIFGALAYTLCFVPFSYSYSHSANYENVTIDTTVNVTNAAPEMMAIIIEGGIASVTLTAGGTKQVTCLVIVRDYNGGDDITGVNATLYYETNQSDSPANNNSHYSNLTCTNSSIYGAGNYYVNYTCNFDVYYYAVNGTWYCNATTIDDYNFTDTLWNTTVFSALFALNVTPLIDYGDMPVGNTSVNKTANITNYGNKPINVTVFSYGAVLDDGLALNCSVNNISAEYQKWSILSTDDYAAKTATPGTAAGATDMGLTIQKQTLPGTQMTNTTYWQLQIPLVTNPFGVCNGSLVFAATI